LAVKTNNQLPYKGAQMPHMQRLTWTGIAMHAGNLPGYPASAGCVRLPVDFAASLYSVTTIGTTVIIADPLLMCTGMVSKSAGRRSVAWNGCPGRTSLSRWSRLIQAVDASGFRRPVAAAGCRI
jgi:hypothetical protein